MRERVHLHPRADVATRARRSRTASSRGAGTPRTCRPRGRPRCVRASTSASYAGASSAVSRRSSASEIGGSGSGVSRSWSSGMRSVLVGSVGAAVRRAAASGGRAYRTRNAPERRAAPPVGEPRPLGRRRPSCRCRVLPSATSSCASEPYTGELTPQHGRRPHPHPRRRAPPRGVPRRLKTPDEVYAFLQDVATVREIHDMAQRLAVARMLAAGEHYDAHPARSPARRSTTISRVSRCLNYGADGYRTVLERRPRRRREARRVAHAMASFVHLHTHSEYSLLDGAARDRRTSSRAPSSSRCPRSRITDHGAMFGAVEFYKTAKKAGIKPIIGCEVYFTHGLAHDREGKPNLYHLLLLAKDLDGLPQPHGDRLRRVGDRLLLQAAGRRGAAARTTRRASSAPRRACRAS